jgi:hypothetical protein
MIKLNPTPNIDVKLSFHVVILIIDHAIVNIRIIK